MLDYLVTPDGSADDVGETCAIKNLALDEALVRARPAAPLSWIWRNPRCVVVGRSRRAERDVDLAACVRDGVPVLRRCTGGRAMYQDRGNLNVTVVLPPADASPLRLVTTVVLGAIRHLGLLPTIAGSYVVVGNRMVSALAALRTAHGAMVHATLPVSTSSAAAAAYLAPEPAQGRLPVTSLAEQGCDIAPTELALVMARSMARELGTLHWRRPCAAELTWRRRLIEQRYGYSGWHLSGEGDVPRRTRQIS